MRPQTLLPLAELEFGACIIQTNMDYSLHRAWRGGKNGPPAPGPPGDSDTTVLVPAPGPPGDPDTVPPRAGCSVSPGTQAQGWVSQSSSHPTSSPGRCPRQCQTSPQERPCCRQPNVNTKPVEFSGGAGIKSSFFSVLGRSSPSAALGMQGHVAAASLQHPGESGG